MKTEALFETMSARVAEECEGNIARARKEAAVIVAEAEATSAASRNAAEARTHSEIDALAERWRQKADAEAAKATLTVKNDAVEQVLAAVESVIAQTVASDKFPAYLEALLAELMAVAKGLFVVRGPAGNIDTVRAWLDANGHADAALEASDDMIDGVAIQDPVRSYRISNTLHGRSRQVLEEARRVCMTSLFDSAETGGA